MRVMAFYSNLGWYRYSSPQDLLQNEWVLFVIVFLALFAMCYMALSNFFFRSKGPQNLKDILLGVSNNSPAKGPVVVISLAVSLMASMAMTQAGYLQAYLGVGATIGVLIFSIIVFAILTLPFYVALEHNFSSKFAGPVFALIVWFVLKYLFIEVAGNLYWDLPYSWRDSYEFVSSFGGLVLLLIAGFLIGLMRNKKGKSN